jgi:hypothetical protein
VESIQCSWATMQTRMASSRSPRFWSLVLTVESMVVLLDLCVRLLWGTPHPLSVILFGTGPDMLNSKSPDPVYTRHYLTSIDGCTRRLPYLMDTHEHKSWRESRPTPASRVLLCQRGNTTSLCFRTSTTAFGRDLARRQSLLSHTPSLARHSQQSTKYRRSTLRFSGLAPRATTIAVTGHTLEHIHLYLEHIPHPACDSCCKDRDTTIARCRQHRNIGSHGYQLPITTSYHHHRTPPRLLR